MSRTNGYKTKENILFQAFILFTKKPYDQVTFEDLEKETGLSRGALLYHFKSKIILFNQVIESSLSSRSYILNIPIRDENCLKNFILDFIHCCEQDIETMNGYGIENVNLAYFNIEAQALYFYAKYDRLSKYAMAEEIKVWNQVIRKAIKNGELRKDTEAGKLAVLFRKLYRGHTYTAVFEKKGGNLQILMDEFMFLYDYAKA